MKNRNIKIFLFIILFSAFLVRIVWIYKFSSQVLTSDPIYYDQTAQSILKGEGYRNGHMFAYRPPIYPYFLAGIYSIFGNSYLPVKIVQAFISIFSCFIMFLLTKRLLNEKAALSSVFLFAFYPPFIRFSGELWTETVFIFLILSVFLFLYKFQESSRLRHGIILGVLLGIASLTREVAFYFLPLMLIWIIICNKSVISRKVIINKILVIIIPMLLIMMPWIVRNYIILKTIIPVSTNGGVNFYMGNNPQANGQFLWILPEGCVWPNTQLNLTDKEMSVAEIAVYKKCYQEGIKFIIKNPLKAAGINFNKLMLLWRPPVYKIDFNVTPSEAILRIIWLIFYMGIIVLSVPGLVISIRMFGSSWLILHFWIIFVSFIQMFAACADSRYFLPIIPALIIFASLTFDRTVNHKALKQL